MNSTVRAIAAAALAGLIGFTGASFAYAQDTSVSAEASVRATTSRPKPLMQLREDARDRIQDLREGLKVERLETRMEIKTASSGPERREIMRGSVEDRKEMRGDARADLKENRDARIELRAEIKGTVKERVKALGKTHIGAVIRRSENALNMFDNLVDRMESRIEKLKAEGTNTASVEASLAASVQLVAKAEADLSALQALVDSVEDSSDPESVKAQIRTAISTVTASIKAAHASLLGAARALAGLSGSVSTETSAEVTN